VLLVTSNVDESRSGTVHCHFEKAPAHLKPGMFINATIRLSSAKTAVIPEEAIVRYEGQQYVFCQKSQTDYELVPVEVGTTENGMIEIKSKSIDLGSKKIVVKNAFMLLSKMKNVSED
jgi:membrane fusion protein, heavy metal efflux system